MGDRRHLSHRTESVPQPQETKDRERTLNPRNKMKTSGDRGAGGSQAPRRTKGGGVKKSRRSSQPTGTRGFKPEGSFAEPDLLEEALQDPTEVIASPLLIAVSSGNPSDNPQETLDDRSEADGMLVDVLIGTIMDEPNTPSVYDEGMIGDVAEATDGAGVGVDTEMVEAVGPNGRAGMNQTIGMDDDVGTPAPSLDESIYSNVSVLSGDSGGQTSSPNPMMRLFFRTLPTRSVPRHNRYSEGYHDQYGQCTVHIDFDKLCPQIP